MATANDWRPEAALSRIKELAHLPAALLPILHALQDEFGYLHEECVPMIAEELNLSRAEVHGVISFYHDFRRQPAGKHILKICRAEACQSMGCENLVAHIEKQLGVAVGETTADGALTVEPVYCLGNCALSPSIMLDSTPYGRVTPAMADTLVDGFRRPA